MNLRDLPATDEAAWVAYPEHRWVYCRLAVAEAVGAEAGPAGVEPPAYPVLWKPTINLWGMGRGAFMADGPTPYQPGLMWARPLSGRHVSTDAVVIAGRVDWSAQALGISDGPGRFSAWFVGDAYTEELGATLAFADRHLGDFTGGLNVETIGGTIIEVHLRLTQDWIAAGAYDGYPAPCRRMVGVPLWRPAPVGLPKTLWLQADDGDPRYGLLVAPLS